MKYTINISSQASYDLKSIYEYIAFELLSPESALNQLDRLEKNIMDLDYMPFKFRKYESKPWRSRNLRVMPVDNYLVLYIPDEKTSVVTVLRVLYGRRNIEKELNEHTEYNSVNNDWEE